MSNGKTINNPQHVLQKNVKNTPMPPNICPHCTLIVCPYAMLLTYEAIRPETTFIQIAPRPIKIALFL
jgi:hypothetical protein